MRIAETHSHLGGEEFLIAHLPQIRDEIQEVVRSVDAEACRTKVFDQHGRAQKHEYSTNEIAQALKSGLNQRDWKQEQITFWTTSDHEIFRNMAHLSSQRQHDAIRRYGYKPVETSVQFEFVKDRVAVTVQLDEYGYATDSPFFKQMSFYASDIIDVGIEILPMKELEREMSSGVPYYERDLLNILRQGRGVPVVPLVLMGVTP